MSMNRRDFVGAAATGIAATGLIGIPLAESEASEASETSVEKTLESVLDQHQLVYHHKSLPPLPRILNPRSVKEYLLANLSYPAGMRFAWNLTGFSHELCERDLKHKYISLEDAQWWFYFRGCFSPVVSEREYAEGCMMRGLSIAKFDALQRYHDYDVRIFTNAEGEVGIMFGEF